MSIQIILEFLGNLNAYPCHGFHIVPNHASFVLTIYLDLRVSEMTFSYKIYGTKNPSI